MRIILSIVILLIIALGVNANFDNSKLLDAIKISNEEIKVKKKIRNSYKKEYLIKKDQYELEVWFNRCLNKKQANSEIDCTKTKDNLEKYANYNKIFMRTVFHKDWKSDDIRQKWLQYFYTNSNYDQDLVKTFLAENDTFELLRKSGRIGANGYSDWGLCQINSGWHKEILGKGNKYFAEWFYMPERQMDFCIKKYQGGTKFYGYYVRNKAKTKDRLIFK